MNCNPGVDGAAPATTSAPDAETATEQPDTSWPEVLAHRAPDGGSRRDAIARFVACGVSPEQVRSVLADGGDALYAAAATSSPHWAAPFGGPLAAALLAAEVSALAAHLSSRASGVRSLAVNTLLDDLSAVSVAARLGVSRQKVYEISRGGLRPPYLDRVPWRK